MIPGLGSRARIPQKRFPILRQEYAQIIELEHFLTANRIPLCRKMLYRSLDLLGGVGVFHEFLSKF